MNAHYYTKTVSKVNVMDDNEEYPVDGVQLLNAIANKDKDLEAAKQAFTLFTSYFLDKIKLPVEKIVFNNGYSEEVAVNALQCTFNKVWLYPTFDKRKSRCKNTDKGIPIWLIKIATSQMYEFTKKGECANIRTEEDLSVIEDPESFIKAFNVANLEPEKKIHYLQALTKRISILDEKHRIIYLTYKAYYVNNKKLPRSVLAKLRKRLGLTQTTVRVYKREACELMNDYTIMES